MSFVASSLLLQQPQQESRLPSFAVAAHRRMKRYKCRARDWLPCIKHATWLGFCHLVSAIFAFASAAMAAVLGYFSYVLCTCVV